MHTSSLTPLKNGIVGLIEMAGYSLVKLPKFRAGEVYGPVLPTATYSPWNEDADFMAVYEQIRGATLVDILKCFELWQLVAETSKLSGCLIEVGAWRGGSAALIAHQATRSGISAPVYVCDTFRGVVKASAVDDVYVGGEHADTSRSHVERLLFGMKLTNTRILEGIFPDETAPEITEAQVRFCHVDVDVYESARDVMAWVDERMVIGGVCVYDDYGFVNTRGITRFVDEQRQRKDRVVIHNLNGHAVVIRIA